MSKQIGFCSGIWLVVAVRMLAFCFVKGPLESFIYCEVGTAAFGFEPCLGCRDHEQSRGFTQYHMV